jgi:hypothetical protein
MGMMQIQTIFFEMAVCRRSNFQRSVWTDEVRPEFASKTDQLKLQ